MKQYQYNKNASLAAIINSMASIYFLIHGNLACFLNINRSLNAITVNSGVAV